MNIDGIAKRVDGLRATLDWKLLPGSHEFPGPDGGTCINEAAVIAAGYDYRSISVPRECPDSFSRTLALVCMVFNDMMDDESRELLRPFITMLDGSRDAPKIERQREEFIRTRLLHRLGAGKVDSRSEWERVVAEFGNEAEKNRPLWYFGVAILMRAFNIGSRAKEADSAVVAQRMERAKIEARDTDRIAAMLLPPSQADWLEAIAKFDERVY